MAEQISTIIQKMSYDFMLAYKPSFTLFQRQILKVVEERTLLL